MGLQSLRVVGFAGSMVGSIGSLNPNPSTLSLQGSGCRVQAEKQPAWAEIWACMQARGRLFVLFAEEPPGKIRRNRPDKGNGRDYIILVVIFICTMYRYTYIYTHTFFEYYIYIYIYSCLFIIIIFFLGGGGSEAIQ